MSLFQGFSDVVHPTCMIYGWYSLCSNTVYKYVLDFKKNAHFSNYEGLNEYMYGTCKTQYIQQG